MRGIRAPLAVRAGPGASAGRSYGPFRVCRRCQDIGLLQPPADWYPESTERELPHEQEALLAEVDAELFPEDAR